ncbi:hypothetical protein ACMYSK_21105 [Klebsiella sp. I138]|uniref:hypothetical protein n=1 Tax=Klebsiella sp. I138 TaxID=2755385 RepID=UPI003DA7C881
MIAQQSEKQLIERSFCRHRCPEKPQRLSGILPREGNIFCRFFIDLDYGSARKYGDFKTVMKVKKSRPDAVLRGLSFLFYQSVGKGYLQSWAGNLPGLASLGRTILSTFSSAA